MVLRLLLPEPSVGSVSRAALAAGLLSWKAELSFLSVPGIGLVDAARLGAWENPAGTVG